MAETAHRHYPLPDDDSTVADEIRRLQQVVLPMIDLDMHSLFQAIGSKAAIDHEHEIGDIAGLPLALAGKMSANRTFSIAELANVLGFADAPNGYVPVKVGDNVVFQAASSTLGAHRHTVDQIDGLADGLADLLSGKSNVGHGHSAATTAAPGFMSVSDKNKLDSIAAQATKNATDEALRARGGHTGEQAIATVTGLQAALDGKAANSHSQPFTTITGIATVGQGGTGETTEAGMRGVYTGTNVANTVFPVGTMVLATAELVSDGDGGVIYSGPLAGAAGTVRVFGGIFAISPVGPTLAGTWRGRGHTSFSTGGSGARAIVIMQRVA